MKTFFTIALVSLFLFRTLRAEEQPEAIILQRLIENKWFDCAKTKDSKFVTLGHGDPLYNGLHEILKKALNGKQLESTVFIAGSNEGPTVRVDFVKDGKASIFTFVEEPLIQNPFKEKDSVEFVFKIGALVSCCYLESVSEDLEEIRNLRRSSAIGFDEAVILAMQVEYQAIKFTYGFYEKYAVPWSKANGVDPAIWKAKISFREFLESNRGKESRKRWARWVSS